MPVSVPHQSIRASFKPSLQGAAGNPCRLGCLRAVGLSGFHAYARYVLQGCSCTCLLQVVRNALFQHTGLQTRFNANMVALVGGQPRQMGLKEMLSHFLDFRRGVVQRRSQCVLVTIVCIPTGVCEAGDG